MAELSLQTRPDCKPAGQLFTPWYIYSILLVYDNIVEPLALHSVSLDMVGNPLRGQVGELRLFAENTWLTASAKLLCVWGEKVTD